MSLFLCAACDRHVRPDSSECPFCGARANAPVPPPTRAHRAAIVLGVASAVLAVESCSSVAVYGAPGGAWYDASPPEPRPPERRIDAAAPPAPGSCEQPGTLLDLLAPPHLAGACAEATLVAIADACFDGKGNCRDALAADRACGACVYDESGAPSSQLGALSAEGEPSTYACAALVLGRPDCAIPAQRAVSCVTTACALSCEASELPSCQANAQAGFCAPAFAAASSCLEVIVARRGEWLGRCTGPTRRAGFLAVARELCGAPATDGGTDAPSDAARD